MKIKVKIARGKIIIKTPGPEAKDTIKKIPGVKWTGYPMFAWRVDVSPSAAGLLVEECARDGIEVEVMEASQKEFGELQQQYMDRDTAALVVAWPVRNPATCSFHHIPSQGG